MCHVSLRHAFHHHISSATLFQRLNVMDLDCYYHNRILRWAGHVARMHMTRAPRQLLTGWVAHSRPNGCPEMTWGRTLKKTTGQLQGMACHSRIYVGVEITDVLKTYASFRELILQGS